MSLESRIEFQNLFVMNENFEWVLRTEVEESKVDS